MILAALTDAECAGARLHAACQAMGVSARTIQRWKRHPEADDRRCGPRHRPANALSGREETQVLALMTSAEYSHLSPKQLVPPAGGRWAVSRVRVHDVPPQTSRRAECAATTSASHGSDASDHCPARGASEPGLELGHHVPPDRDPRTISSSLPGDGRLEPAHCRLGGPRRRARRASGHAASPHLH
jgi:hypothetical protein